ncbi:VanW family protein [Candidatus Roizmanbacteria bacterium]|nr:VanW family protein [Candidatus Roizmanbacteria bacterium]
MTIPLPKNFKKNIKFNSKTFAKAIKMSFWFILGVLVGFFFFTSFIYIVYRQSHYNTVYDGVLINGVNFGGKTKEQIQTYFAQKNSYIHNITITLTDSDTTASLSAKQIDFGYNENLIAQQAFSIGRSDNLISNISLMLQAYVSGVNISSTFQFNDDKITGFIAPLEKKINIEPVDALFNFEDGKVKTFKLSSNGKKVDVDNLKKIIIANFSSPANISLLQAITVPIPIKTVKPEITSEKINNMGIKELIGEGTSTFYHSIENRIYNVGLASSRVNGALVKPGETFSFTKTIGDVSSFTGYKQAYVIENGRTVLGDGGGVCQVSTTLFRAALNAGIPIVERHPHAYRVGYYEQDSGPGIDAATYYPDVDLKFKNDTGYYILIQTVFDPNNLKLTFNLYGTNDGRTTTIDQPVILSQSPAPDDLYQDDPTLPVGQVKQVDFAAAGADVFFTRTVKKDDKIILSDKFVSNYRPWQAIYLRGTKL